VSSRAADSSTAALSSLFAAAPLRSSAATVLGFGA
jgi:hypothetical protein